MQQFSVQVFANAQNQLERFVRLNATDYAGERADGTAFGTRGNKPCRRGRRVLATVARAAVQVENTHLTFELVNGTKHNRNAVQGTGVVNQVAELNARVR